MQVRILLLLLPVAVGGEGLVDCLRRALGSLTGSKLASLFTGNSETIGVADCLNRRRPYSEAASANHDLVESGSLLGVQRIYQGSDARVWAHHAGLCVEDEVRCGGSLIADQWVVTAAHCLEALGDLSPASLRAKKVKVLLGARVLRVSVSADESKHYDSCNNPRGTEQLAIVDQVVRHPEYGRPLSGSNDIALLRLASPVRVGRSVKPINLQLAVEPILPGEECWVMGWGVTEGFAESSVLQEAEIKILPHPNCLEAYGVERIDHSMFCAGEIDSVGANTCKGDSGGSLVCRRTSEWILAGVTSFGDPCGTRGAPGVYSNMDRLLGFISETLEPGRPITQLKVISGVKGQPLACPHGFSRVPQNLQATVGASRRMFLCYLRSSTGAPIRDLRLSFSYHAHSAACPPGYYDLSLSDPGRSRAPALSLCYSTMGPGAPLTDIISIMRYWDFEREENPQGYALLQPPITFDYKKIIFLAYR